MTIRSLPRIVALLGATMVATAALSGCVPNAPAGASAITVSITDTTCDVGPATAVAGPVTFTLRNDGTDVNEFYIMADDQLRIVGEKENLAPGQTLEYTAQLAPGSYYTACKFQLVGAPIGLAEFTVSGEAAMTNADEQELADTAVTNYIAYVKSQTEELVPAVRAFVDAYIAGDDATARELYSTSRVFYERIEPTAVAFGGLDPRIDYREVDALAESLDWVGYHRIEKDLWPPVAGDLNSDGTDAYLNWMPSTQAERVSYGEGLVADVQSLAELVSDPAFTVSLGDISNGAIGLLDEVAVGKITGEEDWWSHTDLSDFEANVQGAEVAFGNVRDLAASKGAEGADLAELIQREFDAMYVTLHQYGTIETGYASYDQLSDAQRKELSDQVNALAEPLSRLTSTILGV